MILIETNTTNLPNNNVTYLLNHQNKFIYSEYSVFPVKLTKLQSGKVEKKPDSNLLYKAKSDRGWKIYQQRKPTLYERKVFLESSHLAIVTGKINKITVFDLDGTAEQDLIAKGYKLPNTPTMRTQSGGKHLYFQYDERLPSGAKLNENKNIDIRNDGGYVVAYGDGYEWEKSIYDTPLQKVPDFLYKEVTHKSRNKLTVGRNKKSSSKVSESRNDAYKQAREINMADFLQYHGYDVKEKTLFSCIFHDHPDENPSAQITTNNQGDYRYICYSHAGENKLNLSLIDLWASINNIDITESIEQVLSYVGITYKESQFVRNQKNKYNFNTSVIGDLGYIKENFPFVHKYIKRYELEYRYLMDYAESNLYGTHYSYNNQAIFYISKRYAAHKIAKYKNQSTVNEKRANNLLNIMCTLGIMERIPRHKLTDHAKKATERLKTDNRDINFFLFNQLDDYTLSIADGRAKKMHESNFKVETMTKDIIIAIFGDKLAEIVYPDSRKQSEAYREFLNKYAKIILKLVEEKGYATKKEVIESFGSPLSYKQKERNFDKVINEICNMYDLNFSFVNKNKKMQLNIPLKSRSKIIYRNYD